MYVLLSSALHVKSSGCTKARYADPFAFLKTFEDYILRVLASYSMHLSPRELCGKTVDELMGILGIPKTIGWTTTLNPL